MSGGFFRGTSADQDTRFSNKQSKLLKSQKFAPELDTLVDITKVKMDVVRPWIATRATELLGFEDEVLINFIYGLLDGKVVDGKKIQIQLTGFMEKNTGKFMRELWALLLSAQNNSSGIPQQFLDAKEEEIKNKKEENDRLAHEIQRTKEKGRLLEEERSKRMDEESAKAGNVDSGPGLRNSVPRTSSNDSREEGDREARNGLRSKSRRQSSSPSRSSSKSDPKSGRLRDGRKSRSMSVSSRSISRSPSPKKRHSSFRHSISPARDLISPRRKYSPRDTSSLRHRSPYTRRSPISRHRSPSPHRRRSPYSRRRSPFVRRRSPSPLSRRSPPMHRRSPPSRRRSPSPLRRRSPSPSRRRSPSPSRRRSPTRRRSPPLHRRSPLRRRSPLHHRSPPRRRSPSPSRHRSPPMRRRSPSPLRRRSPTPLRHRSPPMRRSPSPVRQRSPYQSNSSSPSRSPTRLRSLSPRHRSPSPVRTSPVQSSPWRKKRSPLYSPKMHGADSQYSPNQRERNRSPSRSISQPYRRQTHSGHNTASKTNGFDAKRRQDENTSERIYKGSPDSQQYPSPKRIHGFSRSPSRDSRYKKDGKGHGSQVEIAPACSNLQSDLRRASPRENRARSFSGSPVRQSGKKQTYGDKQVNPARRDNISERRSKDLRSDKRNETSYAIDYSPELHSPDGSAVKLDYAHKALHVDLDSRGKENEQNSHKDLEEHALAPSTKSVEVEYGPGRTRDKNSAKDDTYGEPDTARRSKRKIEQSSRADNSGSDSQDTDTHKHHGKEKRYKKNDKHKRDSDASSVPDSDIEDRKEAKKRRREERKIQKEEKRRRREERHRKRMERRANKLKSKSTDTMTPPREIEKEDYTDPKSEGSVRKDFQSADVEAESEQKRLEIELREKALETLRAKKRAPF